MEAARIVTGCVIGLIAVLLGMYVSFTARCKGPIWSNRYLFATEKERKKLDIKAEYKLVTIVFGCLAAIFVLLALYIFTGWQWTYLLMWIFAAFVVVYAITDAIKSESRKKSQ